jgi:hypothetical protein
VCFIDVRLHHRHPVGGQCARLNSSIGS